MHTIHKYPCLSKAQREERNLCSRVKRHQKLKSNLCSILHFAFPKLSFNSIMLIYTETLIILRWNVIYSPYWIYFWKFQRKRYVDEAIKMLQMSKSFNFSHGFLLVLSSHKVLLNLKTCLAAPTTVSFDKMKVKLIKYGKIILVLLARKTIHQ